MIKKAFSLILIISTLLSLTSCDLGSWLSLYNDELSKSTHNQIEYVENEDGEPSHIIYKAEKYLYVGTLRFFRVNTDGNSDVILSWSSFKSITSYLSNTAENPVYIYCDSSEKVYFHEDYDYTKDTFIIENTSEEIIVEDICNTNRINLCVPNENRIVVGLYSKKHPEIKLDIQFLFLYNQWYFIFPDYSNPWYVASDELVETLIENGNIRMGE